MLSSILPVKISLKPILILLIAVFASFVSASVVEAKIIVEKTGSLGVIKGIVRDEQGSPIADASVAIFRVGTSKLIKQVRSAANGSFLAKILPGTYTVLAVAQGFNAVTISEVEVNRSAELVYGFKLERAGSGNTLPEKRADRKSSKWNIRAAQIQRSIYQANESAAPIDEAKADEKSSAQTDKVEQNLEIADEQETENTEKKRDGQTVVETYFAGSESGNYTGVNFATLQPLGENAEIVFAGQIGTNSSAPKRFQTNFRFRPNENHQVRLNGSIAKLGKIKLETGEKSLGQFSFQALDEWKVSEVVILVFGFDYSRFIGGGNDFSISPRLGFQYDAGAKTRFRAAYTTVNEERTWQRAVELEDTEILFSEPIAIQEFVIENKKPRMQKSSRFEFGVERVLDNKSSIEANVFFDTFGNRGVGLESFSFDTLGNENFADFISNQQGEARGARIVYTRRLNGVFSASAGYAFGNGQKLSPNVVTNPSNVFENEFFQTFFTQFNADFKTGTQVKTVFRLSPQATVFAIDPFHGRLAIYDPSLSVLVTQSLPSWGLPIRAEAIVDARNIFDYQTNVSGEEGSLQMNSQRRILRGGILVRF